MELRQLRYFIAIADRLSFTRAAEDLVIAQPALSAQIQKLEAEVGAVLFVRDKRHVELTDVGRRLLAEARTTVTHADRTLDIGREGARGIVGRLAIGYNRVFPLLQLTRAIKAYRVARPNIDLNVAQISALDMLERLRDGRLDAGFLMLPENALPEEFAVLPITTGVPTAVLPADHPLAGRESIGLRELADEPFILINARDGFESQYELVMRACRQAGFVPEVVQEVSETRLVFGLVAAGLGVSVLSSVLYETRLAGFVRVAIDQAQTLPYGLVTLRQQTNPALATLLTCAAEVATPASDSILQ